MTDEQPKTQLTQPKGRDEQGEPYEPIEIPVPEREDVEDALDRLIGAKPVPQDEPDKDQGDALNPYGESWIDRS